MVEFRLLQIFLDVWYFSTYFALTLFVVAKCYSHLFENEKIISLIVEISECLWPNSEESLRMTKVAIFVVKDAMVFLAKYENYGSLSIYEQPLFLWLSLNLLGTILSCSLGTCFKLVMFLIRLSFLCNKCTLPRLRLSLKEKTKRKT